MEFLLTASIAKSPAEVFAFFRDIDQLPWETHPVVAAYEKSTPGPAGVGSRYCERVRLFAGTTLEIVSEVTVFQPHQRLEYRWRGPAMHGELAYEFRPLEDGTQLVQRQTLYLHGFFRLLSPWMRRMFAGRIAARLNDITAILEGQASF